ncbi:CoA-disulfide reductase [Paenibacillus sp. SC116]|uniref:CoA-disulfide reductase n=1 Tax=Paenibacillus sp. SC116 TaxID=2968986 RepID=UPI00215A73BC|nr:CoA-disulfide reductase [Paenibacillus sp. SC116]MCR8842855.1 CoA-disulfide reductase [Paenibacillus sp. SC116]
MNQPQRNQARTIVIVGGVAGGASAAARLRRLNENDNIILLERGEHISFANCGLPYYIGGAIQQRSKLLVQTVKGMSERFQMDIRNWSEAVRTDRDRKVLQIRRVQDGTVYEQPYDILILSPGAKPIRPDIPGIEDTKALFTLRNIPDTDRIKAYVDEQQPKRAVVIGGGFIGVEMAENLRERGLEVTMIERGNQVMNPIDEEMAAIVHQHMRTHGVELLLGEGVSAFENEGKTVVCESGLRVDTDMIVLAIGVQPENALAKEAGLELGQRGAIRVNEQLQTSDPSIYALGDAIEVKDRVNGQPTYVPLAWGANRQGRLVADIIQGRPARYEGAYGSSIAKVFQLTVASTGNNEKTLKRLSIPYRVVHTHPVSHAGYYPGAAAISLKLIFSPEDGRILGAQGVGADGVDKRIDVLATAIRGGLTVYDLSDLELCYAPPYSSAKDPVNMLGYIASNMMDELVDTVQWHEVDDLIASGAMLIDVREPLEVQAGNIPGSTNIPLNDLRQAHNTLPKDQPIYVSCQVGLRGYIASRMLEQYGFKVFNVDGGYKTYSYMRKEKEANQSNQSGSNSEVSSPKEENAVVSRQFAEPKQMIDARGLQCPGPIVQLYQAVERANEGDVIEIKATDPGFASDVKQWTEKTGNTMLHAENSNHELVVYVQKGQSPRPDSAAINPNHLATSSGQLAEKNNATLVVFSGDLDKAIASFIIATGAAAMGKQVTMFFTFWGLNMLKRKHAAQTDKDMFGKMFGMMMPKSADSLPLSKMNFAGIGPKMIQNVMKRNNVDDLETMIHNAQQLGVKFVACTMSMELMGIDRQELIDGVELGGVATYLGDAEDAGLNLFI